METKKLRIFEDKIDNTIELEQALTINDSELSFSQGRETPILVVGIKSKSIVLFKENQNIRIKGNKDNPTIIYVEKPAIPDSPVTNANRSKRPFFGIEHSENISLKNIIVKSNNDTPSSKPGRPEYDPLLESEHGVSILHGKGIKIINFIGKYLWGDGIYISGNYTDGVYILNPYIDWNGRQGISAVAGKDIKIVNPIITNGRRGAFDIEPNGVNGFVYDFRLIGGHSLSQLLAFPMGGSGKVENILIKDHIYDTASNTTFARGNGSTITRKNIIFSGNRRKGEGKHSYGSWQAAYMFIHAENVLIEKEVCGVKAGRSNVIISLDSCKNFHIRNNDFPGAKYIRLIGSTTPKDVKVYGNKQQLYFIMQNGDIVPIKEYQATEVEKNEIPFEVSKLINDDYYGIETPNEPTPPIEEETPNELPKNSLKIIIIVIIIITILILFILTCYGNRFKI